MKKRCSWCENDELYTRYHDQEWGVPLYDDQKIFEFLTLESFQAGLSWITILRKRDAFRKAFDHFDYQKIALYDKQKKEELLQDSGIVRNRLKIEACINNATRFMEIQNEFGTFSKYMWSWVAGKPIQNAYKSTKDLPAFEDIAKSWSKDLKKRGFKFMGPTVVYSHMQATGMVNDHIETCFRYKELWQEE